MPRPSGDSLNALFWVAQDLILNIRADIYHSFECLLFISLRLVD